MQKSNKYDHNKIEKKWQKYWKDNQTFKAEMDKTKPKLYILDMFPYPSGSGLHVGNASGYTGTDILARYYRQRGFNVLHPIGWDSFGLPAEQYAIKTKQHPAITTDLNIATYKKQLESLGFSYDWNREIKTSDPSYYKWTQWIFTKLYEKGLAYEAEAEVNFCPQLGTVLANEEVENGKSIEGGYPVIKKPLRQWILKITAYAERLIADLDDLDWPENLKKLQINWIGKSDGALISFFEKDKGRPIEIFTTRPDTIFGATYLVMAPEHPLLKFIAKNKKEISKYQKQALSKSDLDRTELAKEKSGVFSGAFAINPVTGKEIPIWVSDYVLMSYGTGAIMAVPAHDERDFEFASKFSLPVISVYDEEERVIHSSNFEFSLNGLKQDEATEKIIGYLEEKKLGSRKVSYKLRDWLFSRQRYWGEPIPILHFEDGSIRTLDLDELPLMPPELIDYTPVGTGESPIAKVKEWVEITDPKTGKVAKRETNTMPQWAGSCWYYLRFVDPSNNNEAWSKEAENYWMPIDIYVGGTEHAVLHLLYARFWHKVLYDCGLVHTIEPFKKYRYQGVITAPSYKKEGGGYVSPLEVEEKEGQFFHVETKERLQYQIEKMSKSKLNGVIPDEIIEEFGADALRLYEMFMGPFDKEKVWNTDAVSGCKRFLNRFFDLANSELVTEEMSDVALKLGYKLLSTVIKDIEEMQFNTAIARMMEFVNDFSRLSSYPKKVLKMATQVLYPFAPHIAEEIWEILGETSSLTYQPLPEIETSYLIEDKVTYVVQINGKLRGSFELKKDLSEEEFLAFAKNQPQIQKYLTGEIIKTFFVPNKLLNIVIIPK